MIFRFDGDTPVKAEVWNPFTLFYPFQVKTSCRSIKIHSAYNKKTFNFYY